jgi:hypothetical protein
MWTAYVNLRLHVNSEGENKMEAADLGYLVFAAIIFALTVVFARYDLYCIIFTNRFFIYVNPDLEHAASMFLCCEYITCVTLKGQCHEIFYFWFFS